MSDEELMLAYQKGSEEAFNELYQKYSSMVYGYVKRRLRLSEVDDFYQKIWRQLHEKRGLYQGRPFAPWFFVLIRNLLIDEYRAIGRKNEQHTELIDRMLGAEVPMESELSELLSTLPPDTAELVRKYYIEGIGYEELAQEAGLSQTGLRQRLSRALRGLKARARGEA